MDPVRLTDLETIRRFSIAVRSEHADADEVIEALRVDLQRLLEAAGRLKKSSTATPSKPAATSKTSAAGKTAAAKAAPRKSVASKQGAAKRRSR